MSGCLSPVTDAYRAAGVRISPTVICEKEETHVNLSTEKQEEGRKEEKKKRKKITYVCSVEKSRH